MLVRMRGNWIPHSWHVGLQHGAAALFLLLFFKLFILYWDFSDGASGKESTCQSRRWGVGSLCRPPGGGNGNPLQCSCLENPMDGGAWQVIVHGVSKSRTRLKWLSTLGRSPLCFFGYSTVPPYPLSNGSREKQAPSPGQMLWLADPAERVGHHTLQLLSHGRTSAN